MRGIVARSREEGEGEEALARILMPDKV